MNKNKKSKVLSPSGIFSINSQMAATIDVVRVRLKNKQLRCLPANNSSLPAKTALNGANQIQQKNRQSRKLAMGRYLLKADNHFFLLLCPCCSFFCFGTLNNQPAAKPIARAPKSINALDSEMVQTRKRNSTTWVF
jgi:hypothetical protein